VPQVVQIAILGVLAAAGLLYYGRMALRLPAPVRPAVDFGKVDAAFAALLTVFIVAQTVDTFGKRLDITPHAIHLSIFLYVCIVLMILGVLIGRDRNPVRLFGLRWENWPGGILFALGSLLAAYPVIFLPMALMHLAGISPEPQDAVEYLSGARDFADRLPMILMAVAVAPVAEEVIFRGYLHGVLRKYAGRWISLLVTSLIFAAMHGHLPALVPLFLLAVALVLVYEKTGSLWAPILMHATFNTVTVVTALLWPDLTK
jgi:membrane protease YdiL (CAAX protease family)